MSNEALWIGFILLDLSLVLIIFRLFGRIGLFGLIVFNLILCNIQVLKFVQLFGLTTTLGNILYASIFLATDLLSEFYGKKAARKGVLLGFFMLLLALGYMQVALLFTPAPEDTADPLLRSIFGFFPEETAGYFRVVAASLAAYLVSQLHDVWAFHFWRNKTGGKHLWLRNNASTLVSQLLDSAIFCLIAFWGLMPLAVWLEILFTTYLFKCIVAGVDTPFIYLARVIGPRREDAE